MTVFIIRLTELPEGLIEMAAAAHDEGYFMLDRLIGRFRSGENRFDRPGEALYAATQSAKLVGIGGLNIDPYFSDTRLGRIRHLYVDPTARRCGVGRHIISAIQDHAAIHFDRLQLYTPSRAAAGFYDSLGDIRVAGIEKVSHAKDLDS